MASSKEVTLTVESIPNRPSFRIWSYYLLLRTLDLKYTNVAYSGIFEAPGNPCLQGA